MGYCSWDCQESDATERLTTFNFNRKKATDMPLGGEGGCIRSIFSDCLENSVTVIEIDILDYHKISI